MQGPKTLAGTSLWMYHTYIPGSAYILPTTHLIPISLPCLVQKMSQSELGPPRAGDGWWDVPVSVQVPGSFK